jgi:hypothetical protein
VPGAPEQQHALMKKTALFILVNVKTLNLTKDASHPLKLLVTLSEFIPFMQQLITTMGQSPSVANNCSAGQEIIFYRI